LVWVWVWVWDWIHSHTSPRTHSPSSRHPPFTHYPFPLPSLVCAGQPSPHKPSLVLSHSTCPPLSSSPHAHSFVLGTAVINTHTGQSRWSSPGHNRTHIVVCLQDTNRHAELARILLDGSATLDAAQATIGHGAAIRPAKLRVFLAFVMLDVHPCQQAASHLACTRPPDFVTSSCSFTVFAPSSSSAAIARILLDGSATLDAAQLPKDSGPQSFGGPHQSAKLLATSFGGLHPFTCLSTHPLGLPFFSLVQGFSLLSSQFPCSMFSHTASFLGVYSICMHHTSLFCVCPPPTLSYCISFWRISHFFPYVQP
jgi:hypothetical protein